MTLAERRVQGREGRNFERVRDVGPAELEGIPCRASARDALATRFDVPLLDGDHVTDDTGTGFVHTAPGHGRDDFDIWMATAASCASAASIRAFPTPSMPTASSPRTRPASRAAASSTTRANKGDANEAVIKALIEAGNLVARGRLKHQYPHSWRSKKPLIFRNTPQWFIAMDKPFELPVASRPRRREAPFEGRAVERCALILQTLASGAPQDDGALSAKSRSTRSRARLGPAAGENRITGMIANRPDWVVSRQRAWGVPIAVFVDKETGEILKRRAGQQAHRRRLRGRRRRRLVRGGRGGALSRQADATRTTTRRSTTCSTSGSIPAPRTPSRSRIRSIFRASPASAASATAATTRSCIWKAPTSIAAGFIRRCSKSCGTRGRAPYDVVLTHGFVLDEKGQQDVEVARQRRRAAERHQGLGADILRLWVAASDYVRRSAHRPGDSEDLRRDLPQAAQHDPLDARRARPLRAGPCCCARGYGATRTAHAASPGGARRRSPRGL